MILRALRYAALATVLSAGPALAQPPSKSSDPMTDATRALFAEAIDAFAKKDFHSCRVKALGAWGVKKHPQIAALLGICEEKLGMHLEAAEHLQIAVEAGEGNHPERGEEVRSSHAKAKKHVGTVRVACNVPGAEIRAGGKIVGETPAVLFFEPGETSLSVTMKGYDTEEIALRAEAGTETTVTIVLKESKRADPDPKPVPEEKAVWPYGVFAGTGAAGIALGIAGVVVSADLKGEADDLSAALSDGACRRGGRSCDDIQQKLDHAGGMRAMGIVGLSLAGAALVGTIVYAAMPAPAREDEATGSARLQLSPWVGDGGGVFLGGSF